VGRRQGLCDVTSLGLDSSRTAVFEEAAGSASDDGEDEV
jgi:hypothetical protein